LWGGGNSDRSTKGVFSGDRLRAQQQGEHRRLRDDLQGAAVETTGECDSGTARFAPAQQLLLQRSRARASPLVGPGQLLQYERARGGPAARVSQELRRRDKEDVEESAADHPQREGEARTEEE
jgi:hypothetical protein